MGKMMIEYKNSSIARRVVGFEDVVIIKENKKNSTMVMQIYYASKVEIKYYPGLCGPYMQSASKMICFAELPENDNGIISASEFSPFGKAILGKGEGDIFCVKLPTGEVEKYTIVSIIDKNSIELQSA